MKIVKFLFSPVFMGMLFIIFAATMAAATFIENDYGREAAYSFVYDTRWFELVILLLVLNLAGQIVVFRLFRKEKLTVMLFHASFIIIAAGAAITRYTGWEGSIHIREGEEQNLCYSEENYLSFVLKDPSGKIVDQSSRKYYISSSSADNYSTSVVSGESRYQLRLSRIIPNASRSVVRSDSGGPVITLMITGQGGRRTLYLEDGQMLSSGDAITGLNPTGKCDLIFLSDGDSFRFTSPHSFEAGGMMKRETVQYNGGDTALLEPMQIISVNGMRIVPQEMELKGVFMPVAADMQVEETGLVLFIFDLFRGKERKATAEVWHSMDNYRSSGTTKVDGNILEISFGAEELVLPFELRLNDFILERYPGSNSPSGYKSEVVLSDESEGVVKPATIFMNNILKYRGYRFYQSSYDPDEKGTILSVNHDRAGMFVTYAGYGLLVAFIILSLLNRNSVFNTVRAGNWSSALRRKAPAMLVIVLLCLSGNAAAQRLAPGKDSAGELGKILVQDQKGRTKPLSTLSNDILRKVARENRFEGLTPVQVFIGIYLDFDSWKNAPLIRVGGTDLQKRLGIRGNMASFTDLVDLEGGGFYKLGEDVEKIYSKPPGVRTKGDKEILKADERVNIIYMIYTGGFLKIFPPHDGSHDWNTPEEAYKHAANREDSLYLGSVIPLLSGAVRGGDSPGTIRIAESIIQYQRNFAGYELPSETKLGAESLYYRLLIFERLFPFYSTLGILMLTGLLVMVIRGRKEISKFVGVLSLVLFAGFVMHTAGLALRWYISGHSPMSNGYESMIFISWVTLMAGFIFKKRSPFALSATAVLAGLTLLVAHLSFMDPEITNLVPVLKSYWLTLHVSVITGSYGFLGLGAILGIISLILMSLTGIKNIERISATLDELAVINYKTLTIGLYLLTAGTFLGAVWANESWGRYWGWDPKETWSLITIVIYSLVIHSRIIPGMKDIFTFNLLSLLAFSSVLMTYFGVNYYLSGLHSYAGGDPVPVPVFVYIAAGLLVALALFAWSRYRKWERSSGMPQTEAS